MHISNKNIKKEFFLNFILNILSSAIPMIVLQIFVLPKLNIIGGEVFYGRAIVFISMITLISTTLGNVLNNIRLIKQNDYEQYHNCCDFQVLLMIFSCLNILLILCISIFYLKASAMEIVFSLIFSSVMVLREYFFVYFRINLNYTNIFYDGVILAVFYGMGFLVFCLTRIWFFIYLFGYTASLIFILFRNKCCFLSFNYSVLFKKTFLDSLSLVLSSILCSGLFYIDKLIIYPILGGASVAVFYSASIFGKMCSMIFSPLSSVALSYLAKMKDIKLKTFLSILGTIFIICFFGYFISLFIGKILMNVLYPNLYSESMKIIKLTTIAAMLLIVDSMLYPIVIKFTKLNNQIYINAVPLIIYILLGLVLSKKYYLYGFCCALVITRIIKILLQIGFFVFEKRRKS